MTIFLFNADSLTNIFAWRRMVELIERKMKKKTQIPDNVKNTEHSLEIE